MPIPPPSRTHARCRTPLRRFAWLPGLLALFGCARVLSPERLAATAPPVLDPLAFFAGHTHSWGVLEDRGGAPTDWLTTDGVGTEADGVLSMHQTIRLGDGTVQHRDWRLRRTGQDHYEATANDMVGHAEGQAAGRSFHWRFTIALSPGDPLKNVGFEQWMYLMDDGALVNRTVIRKLGVVVAEVTEQFTHTP